MRREHKRHGGFEILLLTCLACFVAASAFAQSLGDVARKQRAREKAQPPQHVYTNDDLARPEILLPQDRRSQADRKAPGVPTGVQTATNPATVEKPSEIPLGDVALYYRLQKQLRHLEEESNLPGLGNTMDLARPSAPAPSVADRPRPAILPPESSSRRVPRPPAGMEPSPAGRVRVASRDSLWKLAKQHLGRGARWRELAALNPQIADPNVLRLGEWVRLPLGVSAAGNATQLRVRSGDTLWHLAQAAFGTGLAWTCVAQANPDLHDPGRIYPGQTLMIPPACSAAR